MGHKRLLFLIVLSVLGINSYEAQGAPVLGNLGQPSIDLDVPVSFNEWQASSFTIGSTATSWTVNSVSLRLAQVTANQSLTLRITGQASFRPDLTDVRVRFDNPIIESTSTQTATFVSRLSPAPVLNPGETYWLVLGVEALDVEVSPSTGLYFWSYATNSLTDVGTADGWTFGTQTASAGTMGTDWSPAATTPFSFSIDAKRVLQAMTLARWRQLNPGGDPDTATFLTSDPDGNSLNGLLEFSYDSNRDHEPTSIVDSSSGALGIEYVRWSHAPELRWQVEISSDLSVSGWDPLPASMSASSVSLVGEQHERVRVMLTGPHDRVFLRITITRS